MNAGFSDDPKTVWLSEPGADRYMKLAEEFSFVDRGGTVWRAPEGSRVDGASIPSALWSIVGPPYVGDYRRASIVHDVACVEARNRSERRAADRMFFQACRAGGCSRRSAIILYVGVRIGAWWRYKVLLQEDILEPHLVERDVDEAMRRLFQTTAEEILQAGETDDVDELEARVDAAERHMEERAFALLSTSSIAIEPTELNEALAHEGAVAEMLEPGHQPLPLAAEQFFRLKLVDEPCGEEDRRPCGDSGRFPHSAICYLILNKVYGRLVRRTFRGTGFFVSPDTIVTAGHCLRGGFGSLQSIQVIPGRMGDDWPFGSVMARRWYAPDEWTRRGDVRFDYGVVKLSDKSMGKRTGHFEVRAFDDDALLNATLTTAGYPSDMDLSTLQHVNSGPCEAVEPQRLAYFLDTWKGASGSAVWVEHDGTPVAVGIHNYGHCPNRATRINSRVLADLEG